MAYNKADKRFLKQLGSRIRGLRKNKGWSQEELSFECSLDRTYIGSVERDERNIAIINLRKIADALGISLAELFRDE
jgi:transcriptional regulator with XRE-family HTH domain